MRKIIAILLFSFGFISAHAIETAHYDSLFRLGNTAYQEQNFEDALKTYSVILESGLESADLFYNTANCYYKLNQPTQSILYYEKALLLNPLDHDITYNLELANKQIIDKIEALPVPFYTEWWTVLTHSLPIDTFAYFSILFLLIAVILLLVYFRTDSGMVKRFAFFVTLIALIASATTYIFANAQYDKITDHQTAIVFSGRVTIYSAPNTTSTTLFIVHDGLKVTILKTENKWNQIMLPDGSIGWVPEEVLSVI